MIVDSGIGWFKSSINCLNKSRSSAWSMAESLVPNNSIPNSSKIPDLDNSIAMFKPVCPPNVGKMASGCSLRNIRVKNS